MVIGYLASPDLASVGEWSTYSQVVYSLGNNHFNFEFVFLRRDCVSEPKYSTWFLGWRVALPNTDDVVVCGRPANTSG